MEKVTIWSSTTTNTEQQLRNPILTKASTENDPELPPYSDPSPGFSPEKDSMTSTTTTILSPNNHDNSVAAIVSSKAVQGFLQKSLHLAVDNLFASGTVQQLMDTTLNQVTSFDTACSGSYGAESYDIRNMPVSHDQPDPGTNTTDEKLGQRPRFKRSKTCNQSSSMGVVLGSIWVRTSTLRAEEGSNASSGKLEVITSFIFYPASWLTRIGLRYGTEASLKYSASTGWRFNVEAVRAMPENSLLFDLCKLGDVQAVKLMLARGDASVKDTSPKGWTPLHVSFKILC